MKKVINIRRLNPKGYIDCTKLANILKPVNSFFGTEQNNLVSALPFSIVSNWLQ